MPTEKRKHVKKQWPTLVCPGCNRDYVARNRRICCTVCASDRTTRLRLEAENKEKLRGQYIQRDSEVAARLLPDEDATCPLASEKLILQMLRGEW